MATEATAPHPVAVAAVPCFRVYADVGARLWAAASRESATGAQHPCRRWVEAYGDPASQAGADGACDAADACADPDDAEALAGSRTDVAKYVGILLASVHEWCHDTGQRQARP